MAQKVARLHIRREPGYLYFIKDTSVYRTAKKRGGGSGKKEKVGSFDHVRDNAYMYFLDGDGDVARAMRKSGGRRKKAGKVKTAKAKKSKRAQPKLRLAATTHPMPLSSRKRKTPAKRASTKGTAEARKRAKATMASMLKEMKGLGRRLK